MIRSLFIRRDGGYSEDLQPTANGVTPIRRPPEPRLTLSTNEQELARRIALWSGLIVLLMIGTIVISFLVWIMVWIWGKIV